MGFSIDRRSFSGISFLLGAARYFHNFLTELCPIFVLGSVLLILQTPFILLDLVFAAVTVFRFSFLSQLASLCVGRGPTFSKAPH